MNRGDRTKAPILRSSMYADLMTCPRKFMFRNRYNLAVRDYRAALTIGSAFHQFMASLLLRKGEQPVIAEAVQLVETTMTGILGQADKRGLLPNGVPADAVAESARKDIQLALAMALWYFARDPIPSDKYSIISVEKDYELPSWSIPSRHSPHRPGKAAPLRTIGPEKDIRSRIIVRPDAIVLHKGNGDFYLVDFKTVSQSPSQYAETLSWSFQALLYQYVLTYLMRQTNRTLRGMIHCIIRKPTIRLTKTETWDGYLTRVIERYNAAVNTDDPPYVTSVLRSPFREGMTPQPEFTGAIQDLDTHLRCRTQTPKLGYARFSQNSEACFTWNTPCPYLPLCRSHPNLWPETIKQRYTKADPAKRATTLPSTAPYTSFQPVTGRPLTEEEEKEPSYATL